MIRTNECTIGYIVGERVICLDCGNDRRKVHEQFGDAVVRDARGPKGFQFQCEKCKRLVGWLKYVGQPRSGAEILRRGITFEQLRKWSI